MKLLLTSDNHHADGEHFFVVCLCSDVTEADWRHAGHGKVEGGDVHCTSWRPADQLILNGVFGGDAAEVELLLSHVTKLPKPAVGDAILSIAASNAVEYTSQPVCHQHVEAKEKNKHRCTILQVPVELADDTPQSQQPDHLQGAEQTSDALLPGHNVHFREPWYQQWIRPFVFLTFSEKTLFLNMPFHYSRDSVGTLSAHLQTRRLYMLSRKKLI